MQQSMLGRMDVEVDVSEPADRTAPRVRPHVARAVGLARHVLLDFDGVMFDVRAAMGPEAREQAITDLLMSREHRPRPVPITFAWFGIHQTLAFLVEREPDHAVEAEALVIWNWTRRSPPGRRGA